MVKVAFVQKEAYEKLSVHFLAGSLKEKDIHCEVFIHDLEKDFYVKIVAYKPDYVVYSLFIGEENFAFEYLKKIKTVLPESVTLVGGPFALIYPEIISRPAVDYVFRGDGEKSLPEFILKHQRGEGLDSIKGLCYLDAHAQAHKNEECDLVDVSENCFPNRDVYYKYKVLQESPVKIFIASRGCPYGCTFCYNKELSRHFKKKYWRLRSIQETLEEIKYVKNTYGIEWVHFQDGTLNADKRWFKEFLRDYAQARLPGFLCNLRVENIDAETAVLLKKAGCDRITFGIQSGNDRVRHEVAGRLTTNEQIIRACRLIQEQGIRIGIDIIFGWPGETFEEAMDTIRLCREIKADSYSSNVLVFYPGLRVTHYAFEKGYIKKIPTLEEIHLLNFNDSLLMSKEKKIFINLDKLFFYLIKYPYFERMIFWLLKLPPNKIFLFLKNLHLLVRSFEYEKRLSKIVLLKNYLKTQVV